MSSETQMVDFDEPRIAEFRANLNQLVVAGAAGKIHQSLIAEFRASGGKVSGMFTGAPLLLLTTTSAKSGAPSTIPVLHTWDGDRYVVIASKAGASTNPSWYRNLQANPRAIVEIGNGTFEAVSSIADGEERDRLYANQAAQFPIYAEYQQKTSRRIPVVILERLA
ncbi:MAG: nitroreductase family deazaflavin-dependent oxidoreductase [Dehalococcoidia bacterium]